jgi:RNA polymerase sigma-70 factor (ECF subfamily)
MQSGCEEAFTTLYRHYSPKLYLNILRMVRDPQLAQEMVQELFTRIWQKRDCKGIQENFTGYMYRIAQNLVHDFFRKMQRDRLLMERFLSNAKQHYEDVDANFLCKQNSTIIKEAFELLSPQQKKVYELVKMEGCTYKKAAEIMGISPLTVKEYLVTTNKTLRNYILARMNVAIPLLLFIGLNF